MENYILEAFQKLRLIEDDFDLSADRDVVDELKSFVADDIEEIPDEPIIDVTAEDEEDLSDNYIGKVILECTCCHSRIYKDEADVVIDEESELANIDEECPVCGTAMGYTVIGKIEKFDDDVNFEDADEEEEEVELENDPAEEEPVESLRDRIAKKRLQESPEKYNFNKKDKLEIADKKILTWGEASRGTDYQYDTDKLLLKVCKDVCKELGWDLRNWDFYTSGGTLQVMPLPDKTPSQKRNIRQAFENTCRELYGDDFVVKSNTVTHYGPYDQDGRTFEYTKVGVTPVQVSMSLLNQYPLSFKNESMKRHIKKSLTEYIEKCEEDLDDGGRAEFGYTGKRKSLRGHGIGTINKKRAEKGLPPLTSDEIDSLIDAQEKNAKKNRKKDGSLTEDIEKDKGVHMHFGWSKTEPASFGNYGLADENGNVTRSWGVSGADAYVAALFVNNVNNIADDLPEVRSIWGATDGDRAIFYTNNDVVPTKDLAQKIVDRFAQEGVELKVTSIVKSNPRDNGVWAKIIKLPEEAFTDGIFPNYEVKYRRVRKPVSNVEEEFDVDDLYDDERDNSEDYEIGDNILFHEDGALYKLVDIEDGSYLKLKPLNAAAKKCAKDDWVESGEDIADFDGMYYIEDEGLLDSGYSLIKPDGTKYHHDDPWEYEETGTRSRTHIGESLKEGIENISVDTEDTHLEMSTKEDGGVEIETTPLTEDEFELTDDTEAEVEEPEAEEIVPLTDKEQADILDNEEETLDDIAAEDEEELPIPDEFEETEEEEEEEEIPEESLKSKGNSVNEGVDEEDDEEESDIDDFDECAFNDLVESYLRRVYENVNTFKTTAIKDSGDTIVVEGIIKFKNNKAMKSSFVFTEATETKTGKVVLEGYNTTFSKAQKSFRVRGSLKNNNYVSESLSYNYTARNLTEGKINRTKVCGRVKR